MGPPVVKVRRRFEIRAFFVLFGNRQGTPCLQLHQHIFMGHRQLVVSLVSRWQTQSSHSSHTHTNPDFFRLNLHKMFPNNPTMKKELHTSLQGALNDIDGPAETARAAAGLTEASLPAAAPTHLFQLATTAAALANPIVPSIGDAGIFNHARASLLKQVRAIEIQIRILAVAKIRLWKMI